MREYNVHGIVCFQCYVILPHQQQMQHLCFSVAGENLTSRLRSLSFKAVLRQEIGWFDEERNSSGFLTTRLADDAAKVQGVTGTRVGTLLETSIGMLMALIIAFVYSWVLTLLVLVVIPIVLIGGAAEVKALAGHTIQNKKSLEIAGKVSYLKKWGGGGGGGVGRGY